MKTQTQRLLDYLQKHKRIDPFKAWIVLGIYRLGARIFDARSAGHHIESTLVERKNRFGEICRVAEYRLK